MSEENLNELKNEVFYLTRELRFAVHLIQSALEETERFNLVINDPSFFTFLLLASQGIERLLKLSLSYESILNNHKNKFIPKKYGHSISKLYGKFKSILTNEIENKYNELFSQNNLLSYIINQFTDLLEDFAWSGRYYYTSKETRNSLRFGYYYDEHYIHIINEYQAIKIYNINRNKSEYKEVLDDAIEEAKAIDSDYEKLVPSIFCQHIGKEPLTPFWERGCLDQPMPADTYFKKTSRDFLLYYISPIVKMLDVQFERIMSKFEIPYYFSEITSTINHSSYNYTKKKHKTNEIDIYSTTLL